MQECKTKIPGSGMATLIILDKEMNNITKIVKALEDSGILLKSVTKTTENETKEQKGRFLRTVLGSLGTSLLGNMLASKSIVRGECGKKSKIRTKNRKSWLWF